MNSTRSQNLTKDNQAQRHNFEILFPLVQRRTNGLLKTIGLVQKGQSHSRRPSKADRWQPQDQEADPDPNR